jgi:hypothetical protein
MCQYLGISLSNDLFSSYAAPSYDAFICLGRRFIAVQIRQALAFPYLLWQFIEKNLKLGYCNLSEGWLEEESMLLRACHEVLSASQSL